MCFRLWNIHSCYRETDSNDLLTDRKCHHLYVKENHYWSSNQIFFLFSMEAVSSASPLRWKPHKWIIKHK